MVSCKSGFGDCDAVAADGCETDVTRYFTHCGSCSACASGKLCKSGSCAAPAACVAGNDTYTNASWVVCTAAMNSVWISAATAIGGTYHAGQICKQLGLPTVTFGSNLGRVCGSAADPPGSTNCANPGTPAFDGSGQIDVDADGPILSGQATWKCTP